ncbi:MAG: hypothetical protein NTZ74_03875 [Chloroflexi bacterium]|nr:hypothetical protein [Chloroflexota bacterium]
MTFPWSLYLGDSFWVPPLIGDVLDRLDMGKNPFWKTAERQCWLVFLNGSIAGRICAIADRPMGKPIDPSMGRFGFFECIHDNEVAALLFSTAASWLGSRGFTKMTGPYNPSPTDEIGIQVAGFEVRPVLLTGHNPPYYADLFRVNGFQKSNDLVARRYLCPKGITFSQAFPEKVTRVIEIVQKRSDIHLRPLNPKDWENEVRIATEIYNIALGPLPGFIPIPFEEFLKFANSFKLPDIYEALQKANGKLNLIGSIRFMLAIRHLHRVSFKILMMLPQYQGRGIEALLMLKISERIWEKGYREVDMSLAGEENIKSNRLTDNLGFEVYLRYRLFEKMI